MGGAEGRGCAGGETRRRPPRPSSRRLLGVSPMNEIYWRSLGELDDSETFRAQLEREFPEGASELPPGVTRREMLMLLGASLSLAGLASCRRPVEKIVPYV